jgi:hypothetical protein
VTATARAALIIAASLLVALILARFGLKAFPVSGDEYSYQLQAEIFARGKLAMPPPPAHARHFEVDHVLIDPTLRSKYPPGWPALLAVGAFLGASWAVNGVLAALALAAMFGAARRLVPDTRAVLVALALIAFSPFLLFNAASFHSHTSVLGALAVAFYALVRGWQRRQLGWAFAAGLAIGVGFLIRPVDAFAFGAGLIVLLRVAPRYVVTCVLGAAVVAPLMLVYQALQFGSPFTNGYAAYNEVLREIYGDWATKPVGPAFLIDPVAQWGHLRWFLSLATWMVPGVIPLAVVGLWGRWRKPGSDPAGREAELEHRTPFYRFLLVAAATHVLVILCMSGDQGDSYGPRYLVPLLLPMLVGVAAGVVRVVAWLRARDTSIPGRAVVVTAAALAVCGILRAGMLLEPYWKDIKMRSGLYREVAAAGLSNAVVIVRTAHPTRFARNGITFDGPVLYIGARGLSETTIAHMFPDRRTYVGEPIPGTRDWSLRPVND